MPTPREELYLVVVKPAPPKPHLAQQQGMSMTAWTHGSTATIKQIKAASPEAAAEVVGVPSGATVYVVLAKYVKTFKRPEKAPLVPT